MSRPSSPAATPAGPSFSPSPVPPSSPSSSSPAPATPPSGQRTGAPLPPLSSPPSSTAATISSAYGSGKSPAAIFPAPILVRPHSSSSALSHSFSPVPKQIGLKTAPLNPALPYQGRLSNDERDTVTYGVGPRRAYLDIQSVYPNVAYPPRPVPGSVADMDTIMKYCNFSANKVCLLLSALAPLTSTPSTSEIAWRSFA